MISKWVNKKNQNQIDAETAMTEFFTYRWWSGVRCHGEQADKNKYEQRPDRLAGDGHFLRKRSLKEYAKRDSGREFKMSQIARVRIDEWAIARLRSASDEWEWWLIQLSSTIYILHPASGLANYPRTPFLGKTPLSQQSQARSTLNQKYAPLVVTGLLQSGEISAGYFSNFPAAVTWIPPFSAPNEFAEKK